MEDYPENFAAMPVSISEEKANRSTDGRLWSVRDMLVSALRDIDSGKLQADCAFLALGKYDEDGSARTRFFAKGSYYEVVGATRRALWLFDQD